jgi:Uma2 family endonuclease
MPVAKRLITAEEFAQMPESEHAELIDGEVVFAMPTARGHGGVVGNLMFALKQWAEPEGKG